MWSERISAKRALCSHAAWMNLLERRSNVVDDVEPDGRGDPADRDLDILIDPPVAPGTIGIASVERLTARMQLGSMRSRCGTR